MTQRVIHRPARATGPQAPQRSVEVIAAPLQPDGAGGLAGVMQVMLPILGGGGSLVMILANRNPLMLIAGGIMLAVTVLGGVITFIAQRTGANRRAAAMRVRYVDYLAGLHEELTGAAEAQRYAAHHRHPAPTQLVELIHDPSRLWERRRHDDDFLVVRVGVGTDRLHRNLATSAAPNPLAQPDPVAAAALQRLINGNANVEDVPVAAPLWGSVSLIGDVVATRAMMRLLITQTAALHAPDDVRIVLCIGGHAQPAFEWAKWLPHLLDGAGFDGPVPRRLATRTPAELTEILGREISRRAAQVFEQRRAGSLNRVVPTPRLLVFADTITSAAANPLALLPDDASPQDLGITVVTVVQQRTQEPNYVDVRIVLDAETVTVDDLRQHDHDLRSDAGLPATRLVCGAPSGRIDRLSETQAAAIARLLAPLRLVEDAAIDTPLEATIDLPGLVHVPDVGTYDIDELWQPRLHTDFLRVPFALGPAAQPVFLDLKESAHGGMGPHGLCVGAIGSGKSEVLRTLVLTLAMTHSPQRLNLVLVDYKGGATFAGLEDLPHTAAMVSNLSDDTGLVDRLHDAIGGEINRRQQVLLEAGSLANITDYNARRDAGQQLDPLPNLFVVIDEFGEMLAAKPDFIDLFLQVGRIGRSIGMHLLLASQRLEEGRLRGLDSYISYRLGLRTFSAAESRTVLGVPDAYELPPIAGSGYLKVDTTIFDRFKAAYVSGTYSAPGNDAPVELPANPMPYPLFNDTSAWLTENKPAVEQTDNTPEIDHFAPTTLDVVVQRLAGAAEKVDQIWLPPLPKALSLDTLLGSPEAQPGHGLTVAGHDHRLLHIPIGLLDKPAEQWQGPLELDVSAGAGNVAIMGAPQSGKTTALRTLVLAAALTHTPNDIAFYCLDLGGGGLGALAGLPHVGGVATRLDPDRVRRTVAEVASALTEREQLFARRRLDSIDTARSLHRAGQLPELPVGDVFLVIDNWTILKNEYEDLTEIVQEIGSRGLGYGIHLIISTGRWADLRVPMQAVIGTKLELRLNDPLDSTIDRKAVENIRADTPGRVVVTGGLTAQLCLPRIDTNTDPETAQSSLDDLVRDIAAAWPGHPVPPIRMLPVTISHAELRATAPDAPPVLLGIDEALLQPVHLDLFGTDQHLLVFGDAESGKTNIARLMVNELTQQYTDEQAVIAVFDPRRTLLDVVPENYLGAYAGTTTIAAGLAAGLAKELAQRLPPSDVTTTQLRERSWWKGPEIIVLVDDYDLLSPSGAGPLAPLLDYLPQARDLGLHCILLRRSGGASRAIHEPLIQRLKELGATGLLLSGDRQEGALWPGSYLSTQPPGRGTLLRRGHKPQLIQVAQSE